MENVLFKPENDKLPVWIDVTDPTVDDLERLAEKYGMNKEVVADCLDGEHLPKYEETKDYTFFILRLFDKNAGYEANNTLKLTRRIAVYCTDKALITIHRTEFGFLNETANKIKEHSTKHHFSKYHMLEYITDKAIFSYIPLSEKYAMKLEEYEDDIFLSSSLPNHTKNIYKIKRNASVIKRVILLSKEIITGLESHSPGPVMQDLKDTYTEVESSFSEIVENAGYLINTYISLTSQRTNEIMRILTILSVFFMPLTFIVGVYGMNFEYMPETKEPYGYFLIWIVMILVTVCTYLLFKKKKWID